MARPRGNRILRRSIAETQLRYGPEQRGIAQLLRQAKGQRRQAVRSAEGTAAGLTRATRAARPGMRRVYGEAERSFEEAGSDVQQSLGAGYAGSAAEREAAGASRRLAESKAGALAELSSREVDVEGAKQYGIQQARTRYQQDRDKITAQARDLEAEMGTYLATTYRDLADAERKYKQEQRRIKLSERDSRRLMRASIADITGVDPRTGAPTAAERERLRADRDRDASRRNTRRTENRLRREANKPKGPDRGAITKHQDLVAEIQNASRAAKRMRRQGGPWPQIPNELTRNRTQDSPFGGFDELTAQAGVELARNGRLSPRTIRALKARGLLPKRSPFKRDQGRGGGITGDVQNAIGDLLG